MNIYIKNYQYINFYFKFFKYMKHKNNPRKMKIMDIRYCPFQENKKIFK